MANLKTCCLKKCCFCLPLRKGLLCVGYARLVLCILCIAQFTVVCVKMFRPMQDSYEDAVTFLMSVASIVPQLLDLIFTLMLIVAAHKKCEKLFDVYLYYCVTMVLVWSLAVALVCGDHKFWILYQIIFPYSWYIEADLYAYIGCGAVAILLQLYMTILVRSEIRHLKAKKKAKFARQRSSTSFRMQLNLKN